MGFTKWSVILVITLVAGAVLIYAFTPAELKKDVLAWIKGIWDWAMVAAVSGVAGGATGLAAKAGKFK